MTTKVESKVVQTWESRDRFSVVFKVGRNFRLQYGKNDGARSVKDELTRQAAQRMAQRWIEGGMI